MPTPSTPGLIVHLNSSHPNKGNLATTDRTVSVTASLENLYSRRGVKTLGVTSAVCPDAPASHDKSDSNSIDTASSYTHELDVPLTIPRIRSLPTGPNPVTPHSPRALKRDKAAWRCGLCGYLMLSLDQDGNPIPFACSAFGAPLPLGCPRCLETHTNWEGANPFDALGAHINLRNSHRLRAGIQGLSQLSSSIPCATPVKSDASREAADLGGPSSKDGRTSASRTDTEAQDTTCAAALPGTFFSKSKNAGPKQCYYCGRCHRRLLRVDAWGELVPMNCGADGNVLPILCSGCGELHSEWTIGPFRR